MVLSLFCDCCVLCGVCDSTLCREWVEFTPLRKNGDSIARGENHRQWSGMRCGVTTPEEEGRKRAEGKQRWVTMPRIVTCLWCLASFCWFDSLRYSPLLSRLLPESNPPDAARLRQRKKQTKHRKGMVGSGGIEVRDKIYHHPPSAFLVVLLTRFLSRFFGVSFVVSGNSKTDRQPPIHSGRDEMHHTRTKGETKRKACTRRGWRMQV